MWPLVWAAVGLTALLGIAIVRLGAQTVEALTMSLEPQHWALLLVNIVFMAYTEGYRGFQLRFSPRFARRAWRLNQPGAPAWARLAAPLYAMGYFYAPARVVVTAWLLTAMIIVFVVAFRYLPQPWRGLLDAGVVVGLTWGLIASWIYLFGAARAPASLTMTFAED